MSMLSEEYLQKKYICQETGKMYFEESLRGGKDVKNLEIF